MFLLRNNLGPEAVPCLGVRTHGGGRNRKVAHREGWEGPFYWRARPPGRGLMAAIAGVTLFLSAAKVFAYAPTPLTGGNRFLRLQNEFDIRGRAIRSPEGDITLGETEATYIGAGFGKWLLRQEAQEVHARPPRKETVVAVGRDSRLTGPALTQCVLKGLESVGCRTVELGLCSTPAVFHSCLRSPLGLSADGAAMVTASHLPSDRNGFKLFVPSGGLGSTDVREVLSLASELYEARQGPSQTSAETKDRPVRAQCPEFLRDVYGAALEELIRLSMKSTASNPLRPLEGLHLVVNAGNGAGGFFADVLQSCGACIAGSLHLEPDGRFPSHPPNPEDTHAMAHTQRAVLDNRADLGIAFDTDVDRVGLVDQHGKPLNRNRLIALASALVLRDHPHSTIVTDSVTSEGLARFIQRRGGRQLRFKKGYRNVIEKAQELNREGVDCELAIECSGHAAFRGNRFLDDGAFLAAKVVVELAKARMCDGGGLDHLITDLEEPAEYVELRLRVKDGVETKTAAARVLQRFSDLVKGTPGWEMEAENWEGLRARVSKEGMPAGWLHFRLSLHDPIVSLTLEAEYEGGIREVRCRVSCAAPIGGSAIPLQSRRESRIMMLEVDLNEKSASKDPPEEDDAALDRLGIRHIDESEARQQVLAKAQARWAAAAFDEELRRALVGDSVYDHVSARCAADVTAKNAANRKVTAGSKKSAVAEPAKDAAGHEDSGTAAVLVTPAAEDQGPEDGGLGGHEREHKEVEEDNEPKRKNPVVDVIKESYNVRMGELTPFEEQQLAAKERRDQAANSAPPNGFKIRKKRPRPDTSAESSVLQSPPPTALRPLADASMAAPSAPVLHSVSSSSSSASGPSNSEVKPSTASPSDDKGNKPTVSRQEVRERPRSRQKSAPSKSSEAKLSAAQRRGRPTVDCPICQRAVPVRDPSMPDASLDEHLDRCTRQKASRKPAGAGNGDEEASSSESVRTSVEREEDAPQLRRSGRKRKRVMDLSEQSASAGSADEATEDGGLLPSFVDEQSADEEEEYKAEGVDDDDDEEEQDDRRARLGTVLTPSTPRHRAAGSRGVGKGGKQRGMGMLLVDDFDEEDFRRRVEDYEAALAAGDEVGARTAAATQSGAQQARQQGLEEADEPLELAGGFSLEARVKRRLYWYQRTGVRWLWELYRQGAGGILGDEMGLGKSVQLAAFLGGLHRSGRLRAGLIVAPATLLAQWTSELFSWAPKVRVVVLHKSGQAFGAQPAHKVNKFIRRALSIDGVVIVTTYESLKLYRDALLRKDWDYVALDEGQKIRNPDAEITVVSKQLATVHRVILSGTPIQNNLRELWSLFDFVFPGRLGTLPAFDAELATPIRMGGYSNASPSQAQLAYRCALVLRDLINPYLLRRMKKDIMSILPMPKKTEQVLFCKLTPRQKELYRAALSSPEIRWIFDGKASHFRAITVLRKICNHPDLAAPPDSDGSDIMAGALGKHDTDADDEDDDDLSYDVLIKKQQQPVFGASHVSSKMQVLEAVLPRWEAQGHRVLLFSQTRMMLDILEKMVQRHGWRYLRMDGNTGVGTRPGLIERFNSDPTIFIFLLTTRTGGLGINLTGADRVVLVDPDWNPQTDIQARERAWRLGQKRPVTIYRLVTSGTIEEKIYQRQIYKTAITNRVLQDPKQRRLFSSNELKELFVFKEDYDDDEAPNDTTDAFAEGVVTRTELEKTMRRTKKRRRTEDADGHARSSGIGGGGEEDGEAPAVVRVEEYRGPGASSSGAGREGEQADDQHDTDDSKILKAVFEGKGLSSVLSHDVVEGAKRSADVWIGMQEQARRIAEHAATVLRESAAAVEVSRMSEGNRFLPTWTGRTGSAGATAGAMPRFGQQRAARAGPGVGGPDGVDAPGEGSAFASSALLNQSGAASSSSILSGFRRREGVTEEDGTGGAQGRYVALMDRIKKFFRERGPRVPTREILQNFHDVPDHDAAIFKAMLKELATLSRGLWSLKE